VLRWNPLPHIQNLDVCCYDREYAPESQRHRAREAHLAQWPAAVDASLESLRAVPAPVAGALVGSVRGLAQGINGTTDVEVAALAAHGRLLGRIQDAAASGNPDASLGATALARLLGHAESMPVDLGRLEERADAERDRLRARLHEACERLSPGVSPSRLVPELLRDHPGEEGIYAAAREIIDEATAFVIGNDLLPPLGGACEVGPAPPSRRWAAAMMYWTGPFEDDAPARYYVSPPDESWDEEAKREWLAVFSATMGPAVTVHEVTPGHFATAGCSASSSGRRAAQPVLGGVRRGMGLLRRGADGRARLQGRRSPIRHRRLPRRPRRVTGLACALGVHRGTMTVADATARFEADAFLLARPPGAKRPGLPTTPPTGATRGASSRSCRFGTRPSPPGVRNSRSGASTKPSSPSEHRRSAR